MCSSPQFVLIETLWNVNCSSEQVCRIGAARINRNIVECKSFYLLIELFSEQVLIETLWNVNYRNINVKFEPFGY